MLDLTDIINLLNVLKRSKYEGLEEAQVATALAAKLTANAQAIQEEQFHDKVEKHLASLPKV